MVSPAMLLRSLSVFGAGLVSGPRFLARSLARPERVRHFGVLLERGVLGSQAKWERVLQGRYERGEARCLLVGLEAGDVVLEIGAGVGFTSALAAGVVGSENVFCYEANPELVERIRRTHALNGVSPAVANVVLGAGAGEVDFFVREDFSKSSLEEGPDALRAVRVPQLDVNDEIRRTGATCVVLDVEGAEEELVRAIDWTPLRKAVIELHPQVLGAQRTAAIVRELERRGLRTVRIASSSNKRLFWRA